MPRRRDKRTDTENSDDYDDRQFRDTVTHYGTAQLNRFLAPDQIQGDDATKYSIRAWSNILQAQRLLPWNERKDLFERALSYLPYSYKIWHMYLTEFVDYCSTRSVYSKQYKMLNETFERALEKLPKMPRLWLMYSQSLSQQHLISKTRQVYNWSFRNLPLTQHDKIWNKYSTWVMKLDNTSTALRIIPRYLKINPDFKEQFADYLYERGLFRECVSVLRDILEDEGYSSKAKMTKKDFELHMIDIVTEHPDKVPVDGERIIREAIEKYERQGGKLWVKLGDYYIKLGQLDKARDILEEAINKIDNVKDFGVIFNAYCKFEQQMITVLADKKFQEEENVVPEDKLDEQIQYRLAKLQSLVERRPFLLHKINIRKNPNNVREWLNYVTLYQEADDAEMYIQTLEQASEKINPHEVTQGHFSEIIIAIGRFYKEAKSMREFNLTMQKGTQIDYRQIEDYYRVWSGWAEMLLEAGYFHDGLKVIEHILFGRRKDEAQTKVKNAHELLKTHTGLWQLYIDLSISLNSFEHVKKAYEKCKQRRCLTPLMLINFTNCLWENAYFEESFRMFQYAVSNFSWPSLYQIWIAYITKFIMRYGQDGIGVERTRSMFERVVREAPKDQSSIFWFLYAEFEEQYGLYSHAIEIYDRMVNAVPDNEKYQAYNIYIAKVSSLLGITKTRAIFESAMQKLSEKEVLILGRKYASLEKNLGETDRARAIFTFISQSTDPKDDIKGLWAEWEAFEVECGDKETYKQYLRIKRSVEAKFMMLPPDLQKIEDEVKKGLAE